MRTAVLYNFLLEATIIASIAILLMIPIRKFLRKYLGSGVLCFAWLLVALRLLCPLALPNPVIHEIVTPYNFDQENIRPIAGQVQVRIRDAVDRWQSRIYSEAFQSDAASFQADPRVRLVNRLDASLHNGRMSHFLMYVYAGGVLAVAAWYVFSNVRFRRQLKKNRIEALSGPVQERYEEICRQMCLRPVPVYLTDPLPGACLVSLFRPWIALPAAASMEDAEVMLRHELCHVKAHDPCWAAVQMVCCAVHWFNPLVWAAAAMCRMDREMKCDDSATKPMDQEGKRRYAAVLVQSAALKSLPTLPVLATGMSMTGKRLKTRIGAILNRRTGIRALAGGFAVLSTLLLVCAFATADNTSFRFPTGLTATSGFNLKYQKYIHADNQLLTGTDKALDYARGLWRGEYLARDTSGARWDAQRQDMEDYILYSVRAVLPDGVRLYMNLLPDGAVDYLFVENPPADGESDTPETAAVPTEQELRNYVLRAAEALEKGVTEKMTALRYGGAGGNQAHFAIEVFSEDTRYVTIELSPVLRITEYGTGNG